MGEVPVGTVTVRGGGYPSSGSTVRGGEVPRGKGSGGGSNNQTGRVGPGSEALGLVPVDQITQRVPDHAGNQHCG
jgi:hypothetical protein